jgi:serine/threonine protein kinase
MSPEIIEGKKYNNKIDVWALGCVAYETMCLNKVFQGTVRIFLIENIFTFLKLRFIFFKK